MGKGPFNTKLSALFLSGIDLADGSVRLMCCHAFRGLLELVGLSGVRSATSQS